MDKFKSNIKYLSTLLESKDHLIDNLSLTDDQKTQLKDFFRKYPNLESKIDWNRKNLTFEDFQDLLATEGKSKSQAKKVGLGGLIEGVDYKILEQSENYIAYQPLTYLGSETIASNKVPPVKANGAKWCTAYQKTDMYWNRYTIGTHCRFCYICTQDTKYALVLYPSLKRQWCFSFSDEKIECPPEFLHLFKKLMTEEERERYETKEKLRLERTKVQAEEAKQRKQTQQARIATLPDSWQESKRACVPYEITLRSLIKRVSIPEGIIGISFPGFDDCKSLTSITLPSTLKEIGRRAFHNCISLKEIEIPESVTKIEAYAFADCRELKAIQLPKNLTELGQSAFLYCEKLRSIEFPESLTDIPSSVCSACPNLETIIIPKSIKSLKPSAFWYISVKAKIYYRGTKEEWKKIKGSEDTRIEVIYEFKG